MRAFRDRVVAVVLAASLAASCTAYKPVTVPGSSPAPSSVSLDEIEVGDVVRIVRADHQRIQFRVTAIEPDALVGEDGQRAAYADIVFLELRALDKSRTTLLVLSPLIVMATGVVLFAISCVVGECR